MIAVEVYLNLQQKAIENTSFQSLFSVIFVFTVFCARMKTFGVRRYQRQTCSHALFYCANSGVEKSAPRNLTGMQQREACRRRSYTQARTFLQEMSKNVAEKAVCAKIQWAKNYQNGSGQYAQKTVTSNDVCDYSLASSAWRRCKFSRSDSIKAV